jgi:hypothetical protein
MRRRQLVGELRALDDGDVDLFDVRRNRRGVVQRRGSRGWHHHDVVELDRWIELRRWQLQRHERLEQHDERIGHELGQLHHAPLITSAKRKRALASPRALVSFSVRDQNW